MPIHCNQDSLFTQITLFTLKGRVITITCISNSAKRKVEISLAFSAQRHWVNDVLNFGQKLISKNIFKIKGVRPL